MLSDDLGEKKIFAKGLEFLYVVFNVIEKMWSCIFVAGFCFVYKDATRKTEWFFCIRNISKTKRSLVEKLWDIVKHT